MKKPPVSYLGNESCEALIRLLRRIRNNHLPYSNVTDSPSEVVLVLLLVLLLEPVTNPDTHSHLSVIPATTHASLRRSSQTALPTWHQRHTSAVA